MANGGLGIAAFLKHASESGGNGQWLRQWNKDGKGEITFWLHTKAPIVPSFSHSFMLEDESTDKETGRKVQFLRYMRFISPDPERVSRDQFFRNESDGSMKILPDRDPFLILREWLRRAEHLALEEPIFKWNDPKKRQVIVWERGSLTGQFKKNQNTFGHSLDTKLEYVFIVVDNEEVDKGPVLARLGKLPSQRIQEVIKQQVKMFGEEHGNPTQHPYAFLLVGEDSPSPMNRYKAFKAENAAFTDEVWNQIASDEFPDPTPHGQPADGDMLKIRDAMESAAQVDLPLDQVFSEDPDERKAIMFGSAKREPARASKASAQRQAARPPAPTPKPAAAAAAPPAASAKAASAPATKAGPQTRRRRVEAPKEPEPAPEPQVEIIPCEECGADMLATDTECKGCGSQYEPIEDDTPAPPPPPKPAVAAKPSTATKPKPTAGTSKPATTPKPTPVADAAPEAEQDATKCWACQVDLNGSVICPSCGMEQSDDIPF